MKKLKVRTTRGRSNEDFNQLESYLSQLLGEFAAAQQADEIGPQLGVLISDSTLNDCIDYTIS